MKRGGRIWIRVFPDKPISTKPAEVRMGNGKGNPEYYVAEIQPGKIVFEIVGVPEELAREAFRLAAAKLPAAHDVRLSAASSAPERRTSMATRKKKETAAPAKVTKASNTARRRTSLGL